jgi:hypothetical protein
MAVPYDISVLALAFCESLIDGVLQCINACKWAVEKLNLCPCLGAEKFPQTELSVSLSHHNPLQHPSWQSEVQIISNMPGDLTISLHSGTTLVDRKSSEPRMTPRPA